MLFGEITDEELGSVENINWFGLLRHEDPLGGMVLSQNPRTATASRRAWETESDNNDLTSYRFTKFEQFRLLQVS